ncbi:Endonuclease/Exonuclease/phosphatase family protein [Planctomycetes bacterium CA13]|uniref:Endonuclease/Exonuclease/phosphatase family protein n=1 Tax=Novipirellula herctigrandis TaxID=2527986 RepID=A0A5C5Z6M6_9BACT|nr:Endonuclease/Exonuclease/phosphatase family protein [Planctomycetes bacterium CA13]
MKRSVLVLAIAYLVLLLIGWGLLRSGLNTHWLGTLFLFSPRWVVALPIVILLPITFWCRWKLSCIYLLHLLIILFPIMGYKAFSSARPSTNESEELHILTSNVGGGDLNIPEMIELVHKHKIDVLLLQECEPKEAISLFDKLGWPYQQRHQIVIASTLPMSEARVLARQPETHYRAVAAAACTIDWKPERSIRVVSIHLPTFRPAFAKMQAMNFAEGPAAIREMGSAYCEVADQAYQEVYDSDLPTIIAGDFNAPADSEYFRRYWGGYVDSRSAGKRGFGYTKFTKYHGVRIDHLLVDSNWTVIHSEVGPDLGGDHRSVIVALKPTKAMSP